jgi:glycogen synthase
MRVSIAELKEHIRHSSALIVPSLYDPFCLMPLYALAEDTVSFVSRSAGVAQNILTEEYLFDPLRPGDLLRAVQCCHRQHTPFVYEAAGSDCSELYLDETWH